MRGEEIRKFIFLTSRPEIDVTRSAEELGDPTEAGEGQSGGVEDARASASSSSALTKSLCSCCSLFGTPASFLPFHRSSELSAGMRW